MGDEPQTQEVGDLLDDADVAAAVKATETEEKPTETPAAPKSEPEKGKEDEEFDRSSSFRDAMKDLEKHLPEDQRQTYRNRIEQAERWAAASDEAKEVKGKLGEYAEFAKTLAPLYEGGEEYLKTEGPIKFLKQWQKEHGPGTQKEPEPKPEGEETEDERLGRIVAEQVKKANAPLLKEQERLKVEREQKVAAEKFAADFDPRVEEVVGKWNLPDDAKADVGNAFADLAQNLYMSAIYLNPDNPDSVTVASAVAKAVKVVNAICDARTAKRPTPPRPTVEKVRGDSEEPTDYESTLDSLDVSDDIDHALGKGG